MLTSSYLVTFVTSNDELNFLHEISHFEPHVIWEKLASMHNYKYLEMPILIIRSIVSQEEKQMLACSSP